MHSLQGRHTGEGHSLAPPCPAFAKTEIAHSVEDTHLITQSILLQGQHGGAAYNQSPPCPAWADDQKRASMNGFLCSKRTNAVCVIGTDDR